MRQAVPLKDPVVIPKLVEFSTTLRDLEALQEATFDRCRRGEKDACASMVVLELFIRATRRNDQLHREARELRRVAREQT